MSATVAHFQVMPDLDADEFMALTNDIIDNGIQVPIIVDEHGAIIDGHHRHAIATAYNLECPRRICPEGLSEAEKRTLAYGLNLHRRHLSREQKRELIAASLKADPILSDRQHGERTGSDHKTVGAVRNGLESTGEIPQSDIRTGADGRDRPATQPSPEPTGAQDTPPVGSDPRDPEPIKPVPDAPDPADVEEWEDRIEAERPKPADDPQSIVEAIADEIYDDAARCWDAVKKATESVSRELFRKHEIELLAEALSDDDLTDLDRFADLVHERTEAIRAAKPRGLHVVQGGR